jgi:uncharacterized protein (UPF0261 family)
MRTSVEENAELGKIIAQKLNASVGPVSVLIPTKAISVISAPGKSFHDPEADRALFENLKSHLKPGIPVLEMETEINDLRFARACAEMLLSLLQKKKPA